MTVLEYFRCATLHGLAVAMKERLDLSLEDIDQQLRKVLFAMGCVPEDPQGWRIELEYIVPTDEDPAWEEPYWAVHGRSPDPSNKDHYSIALTPWGEILAMSVSANGPWLSVDEVVALIAFEMTASGDPLLQSSRQRVDQLLGDAWAYAHMFQDCTELDSVPEAFARQYCIECIDEVLNSKAELLQDEDFELMSNLLYVVGADVLSVCHSFSR